VPYFFTEQGETWTPIGQNDAITWPDLAGVFRRKDLASVENYLAFVRSNGVTCLRLMLEYSQTRHRYLENPVGTFQPNMVKLWDDLFMLCAKYGIRILLTPYDTFWMWRQWKHHPYNRANGGPCNRRTRWLLCGNTFNAIKGRLEFAARRWSGSGVLFAWDLWNEIHPSQAEGSSDTFVSFVEEISSFLRKLENQLHGRSHPQTVSMYGQDTQTHTGLLDVIFRHPSLDFASTHFYDAKTIDRPRNTVAAALTTGAFVREALLHITDNRPFLDSEHGPIHTFKNRRITLPEPFDNEYFRHIQWAHLASGAAGGGLRWPYRHPHSLTKGMRAEQRSLAEFVRLLDWTQFGRRNLNHELQVSSTAFAGFACGDQRQAIVWLLRQDRKNLVGMISPDAKPLPIRVGIPGLSAGNYRVTLWDTAAATTVATIPIIHPDREIFTLDLPSVRTDLALAVKKEA
jgi:mannan endo-1,4-beta-mannosidase